MFCCCDGMAFQAFSGGVCKVCGNGFSSSTTPPPALCEGCAQKQGVCQYCELPPDPKFAVLGENGVIH